MNSNEKTKKNLAEHIRQYPHLEIRDIFKYIFQSSFGCEHLVASPVNSTDYIRSEYEAMAGHSTTLVDPLDGDYSRVHLEYINRGLGIETLGRLFYESAQIEPDGKEKLEDKLRAALELAEKGEIPFSKDELEIQICKWREQDYPAVHHSDTFRREYAPAYRLVSNRFVPFLPLFAKLDTMPHDAPLIVAVEGGSASGKSTLGEVLQKLYDCTILHTDDFFLRPEQRTPERYAQIGGNLDRERLIEEVLTPLKNGEDINYRRFDCSAMTILPPVVIKPKRLVVVEGAYSMHPLLRKYYDLSVFLDVCPTLQKERIAKRNTPQMAEQFHTRWIPLERTYFEETQAKQNCDMVIKITN